VLRNANKDAGIKRGWSALKMKGLTGSQGANGPLRTGILVGPGGHYVLVKANTHQKGTGELFSVFS